MGLSKRVFWFLNPITILLILKNVKRNIKTLT